MFRVYWGLYWDNGKDNGNYCSILGYIIGDNRKEIGSSGFRHVRVRLGRHELSLATECGKGVCYRIRMLTQYSQMKGLGKSWEQEQQCRLPSACLVLMGSRQCGECILAWMWLLGLLEEASNNRLVS